MHPTSHLHLYEEDAHRDLLGLRCLLAGDAERVLTAADVEVHVKRLIAVGEVPCAVIVELPMRELGCATTSWEDLLALRRLADKYGFAMHLDGA